MTTDDRAPSRASDDLGSIASLAEPNRRALFDYVTSRRAWVSREQAADGVGLRRGIAAHHLDRLADDGLLETDYLQLSERRGPGSGRPAKVYRRSSVELGFTLPPRRYEVAGQILAEAVDCMRAEGASIDEAIERASRNEGHRIGATVARALGRRSGRAARRAGLMGQLEARGFDPEALPEGTVILHNCPFHRLAEEHTELICGMNHCLLDSILSEVEGTGLVAHLEPEAGSCCVRLRPVAVAPAAEPGRRRR